MIEKLILENRTNIPMAELLTHVGQVLAIGRISNNDAQYCYATKFDDGIIIYSGLNDSSDRLTISTYKKEEETNVQNDS